MYVHMHIVLNGMENSLPKRVAINFIITNDVAIIPVLIQYSF
jgi:hypothetical protein